MLEAGHVCSGGWHKPRSYAGAPFVKDGYQCAPWDSEGGSVSSCTANAVPLQHAPLCACVAAA
jgi:hypothetical protein